MSMLTSSVVASVVAGAVAGAVVVSYPCVRRGGTVGD